MINGARRKTPEDFFMNYFTSHFICKVSKRVTQSLRVSGSWWPNITEIFWPRQRCVFLVLHGCSNGALESTLFWVLTFPTTSRHSHSHCTACPPSHLSAFCSICRPYITFKLPRGDMDTPPRLRNFFRYLATGMCHFRYLWNGLCNRHRAEITVMQFSLWEYNGIFFLPRLISSANFRPRDFLS